MKTGKAFQYLYVRQWQVALFAILMFSVGAARAQENWRSGGWVLDVSGRALSAGAPLKPATILGPDVVLTLEKKASVTMFLPGSEQKVIVAGPGKFMVYPNRVVVIKGRETSVTATRPQARFPRLDPDTEKTLGGVVLRSAKSSAPDEAQALVPEDEKVLAADVRFSWPKQLRRAGYKFRLFDDTGSTIFETLCNDQSLVLPEDVRLRKGARYSWLIEWQGPNGAKAVRTARFTTLSADEESFVVAQRPRADAPMADRRLYAMWLGAMGAETLMRQVLPPVVDNRR